MKKKIFCILFCLLLIIATILPVVGTKNELANVNNKSKNFINNPSFVASDNGVILDQELDKNNKGYTIIRIGGSNYEMGYAQAERLGEYIIEAMFLDQDSEYMIV